MDFERDLYKGGKGFYPEMFRQPFYMSYPAQNRFMDEAEYCDRIGLVYHGKLIASGTPDALKAQAADDSQTDPTMEQAFITLINRWDKENGHEQ